MPDLATISSILSSVKTATEIAKLLKDSDISLESAETKLKLAELVGALADAKLEVAGIQELLLEKDKTIKALEESLKLQEALHWKEPVYYLSTENGEDGPFCPQCYDNERKVIRLQTYDAGHWHCMTCDKSFFSQSFKDASNAAMESDYDPYI